MSNTVITNYTDLNGPSTKADSSVVVIVNKDGSLSVDQNLLGTLMGSDGSQAAGISVVRVGHEGKPDDATDTESEDEKIPHVTLSVDSYYDEPNSIIKYDSGAEMLQSLRIETRENSLLGFQNDHCYTPLTSPDPGAPQRSNSFTGFDEPILEITHTPPPKPVPQSKKITILEQQIIPKGKKLLLNQSQSPVLKGHQVLKQPLQSTHKSKHGVEHPSSENTESSSLSSGESIPDRDSDSDYKDDRTSSLRSVRKSKLKPRILKAQLAKATKLDTKVTARLKTGKDSIKKELRQKIQHKNVLSRKSSEVEIAAPVPSTEPQTLDIGKGVSKQTPKTLKKEKKTPAHVTALLSDMTSLFSSPDVIRRVSTDAKTSSKPDKELPQRRKMSLLRPQDDGHKSLIKQKEKVVKEYDPIPQLDDVSLAQILEDTTGISSTIPKVQQIAASNTMGSPGLAGPLSPTLDLLGGLQPEEEGLTEDLLMHVAHLVESSENLQEVIDKQVLGKVDTSVAKTLPQLQQGQALGQTPKARPVVPQKSPIEIVRRDGRVITLPPIEAPATRSSKRKVQPETQPTIETTTTDVIAAQLATLQHPTPPAPEPIVAPVPKLLPKKLVMKKSETPVLLSQEPVADKISAEASQESWNSEDDPYRLWCICKQPHNNRFMICCDGCEDWFHGKCVNITKIMGQQMEEQGIEWRCPNCIKNRKPGQKMLKQLMPTQGPRKSDSLEGITSPLVRDTSPKTGCIVCKRPTRASSIYCSDACILKHAQDSLGHQGSPTKDADPANPQDKPKSDSRVIVYERKSGRLLAGPNAPTAENLRQWLQRNPTFEVVRPGTLHTIKPNLMKKKPLMEQKDPKKIQTTLPFERIPRKSAEANPYIKTPEGREKVMRKLTEQTPVKTPEGREKVMRKSAEQNPFIRTPESREKAMARMLSPRDETTSQNVTPQAKTPSMIRQGLPPQYQDTPRPSTSTAKPTSEPKKAARPIQRSSYERVGASPSTSRRKEAPDTKKRMESTEPIRENVRKALQEQMTIRMNEIKGSKFTKEEIKQFAIDTELELHELFKDVGMKYKVKYRSLIFNIKDRKNLSLWKKICERSLTPKQLVRMSPEELASQELAQWREEESKHQLELIKKSELDLLAASKTYVLKTHKGEEVMEEKESVSAELDPNTAVEDVVSALNEAAGEDVAAAADTSADNEAKELSSKSTRSKSSSRKRGRDEDHSKKGSRSSKRDFDRKSKSRRRSESKEKDERSTRRSDRKSRRDSSPPKDKKADSKEKERDRSRHRSRSRGRSKRGRSREHSRSASKGRDTSRSRRRSSSKDDTKRRRSTRNKQSSSTEEKAVTRARSQDIPAKPKHESPDSDTLERPKSAMLKESHPEYDPHEPMITSAFSEEDLRKSGAESYEEMGDYGVDYDDPTKDFTIDTSIVLPPMKFPTKHDKSEAESDQEPSSTVDNAALTVWNGCINMVDVARFYVAAHEASGSAADIEEDLSAELDIVGRINPETVWEYIGKMKRASNKDIIILRLQAANDEEKMQYIALYSYLNSRNRLGVVKVSNSTMVKDIYIVPLSANTALPSVLLPLDGPGLGENKTHLLLAIVIRQRKRPAPAVISKDLPHTPPKVTRTLRKRSYTPPPIAPKAALPLPATYTSPALSTSVKDKIAASIAAGADMDEPYSPGSSSSSGSASAGALAAPSAGTGTVLRSKMEELNRQIAEQKQQILKMAQADSSVDAEEAYSPSRPMTPPDPVPNPLADIALPSNLHEILATIKQRETGGSSDLPPP